MNSAPTGGQVGVVATLILLVLVAVAIAVGVSTDASPAVYLLLLGSATQGTGILWVATPELAPTGFAVSLKLADCLRRAFRRIRRLFGLGGPPQTIDLRGGIRSVTTLRPRVSIAPGKNASIEHKVEFLLQAVKQIEEGLARQQDVLDSIPEERRMAIEAAKTALTAQLRGEMQQAQIRYLGLRLCGIGLAFLGVVIVTWADLILVQSV